jgi:hypothetical protein
MYKVIEQVTYLLSSPDHLPIVFCKISDKSAASKISKEFLKQR